MKAFWTTSTLLGMLILVVSLFWSPQKQLFWNRTESAPLGLYWLSNDPITKHCWVIVSANSEAGIWAQTHKYTGKNWPLIKRVYGLPGDEVCRKNKAIFVNGAAAAVAHSQSNSGIKLPNWSGCFVLQTGEYFLLNSHPKSLDGRYFGATNESEI